MTPLAMRPEIGRPGDRRDDDGFTLVELLVATSIMAIVTATLGFSIVGMLRSSTGGQERLARAHDTSMVGTLFPDDVNEASAGSLGGAAPCGVGSPVLTLATTDVAGGLTTDVWYGRKGNALIRTVCTGSSVATSISVVDSVSTVTARCQRWSGSAFVDTTGCSPWATVDRIELALVMPATPGPEGTTADPARTLTLFGAVT